MDPGRMDRRIIFQKKILETNSLGEKVEVRREDLFEVWAEAIPIRGREYFEAKQLIANFDMKFRVYYRKEITPLIGILFEGRTYDIQSVAELGRREYLEILAVARAE